MRKLDDFTVFRFDVVYDEIITVSQKRAFRIGTVVGVDSIVNRIAGFGGVKLTRIAIFVTAVIVVDTLSDVACLLKFREKLACAYGVDTSGRKKECVAGCGIVGRDNIHDAVVGHASFIIFGRSLFF